MRSLEDSLFKINSRITANAAIVKTQEQRARAAMPADHLAFVDALEKKFGLSAFLFQMGKRVFKRGTFSNTPE